MSEIFSGNKGLFKDLWIGKSDFDWQVRPVLYFDFNEISSRTVDQLVESLHSALNKYAKQYGIVLTETSIKIKFIELIETLGKTINPVAVIIDEYEIPLTFNIDNRELAESLRIELADFYATFKGKVMNENLYFLFVTGVTKFAKISLSSELNNLTDLTYNNNVADIVGYTDEEVDLYFREHIKALSSKRGESYETTRGVLKTWYNGYRFSGEETTVYNPFSLHNCLDQARLTNFWFTSGTTSFLKKFISKNPVIATDIETIDKSFISETSLGSLTIEDYHQDYKISFLKTLLLQTGYLTFASGFDEGKQSYKVRYPNEEVRYSIEALINLETAVNCSALFKN